MKLEHQVIGFMQKYLNGDTDYSVCSAPIQLNDGIIEASIRSTTQGLPYPERYVIFRATPKGTTKKGIKCAELRIEECTNKAGQPYHINTKRYMVDYD